MRIRVRIAALLAASFVMAGAVVLGIGSVTYQRAVYESPTELTDHVLDRLGVSREQAAEIIRRYPEVVVPTEESGQVAEAGDGEGARQGSLVDTAFQQVQRDLQDDAVERSRMWSIAALAVMALVAAVAGWMIAGRAMSPLRTITARARAASGADLSGRVALDGPHDEIRELGDTFDDMLDRLERAFVAQRRFSAQVSHEIRTPLAIISSETDLLLRDAGPPERESLGQIRAATDRAERIVGALLVLARSGSGALETGDLRLDHLAGDLLGDVVNGPDWRRVRVDLDLEAAAVRGDRALLERLVGNLLSNAARHNRPDGWVELRTRVEGDWSVLEIENSVAEEAPAGGTDGSGDEPDPRGAPGSGVGLTVVDSVLAAHGGELTWTRDHPDRVMVSVRLPRPPAREQAPTPASTSRSPGSAR
jgi:signal transduction histidine kinase